MNNYNFSCEQGNHDFNVWIKEFEDMVNRLSPLLNTSEDQFLFISTQLQKFYSMSKEISQNALEVINLFSDSDYEKEIENLKNIYERIYFYLNDTQNNFNESEISLTEISNFLYAIRSDAGNFDKLARYLRFQGISTKIESARFNGEDKGFNNLADNITNLSSLISENIIDFSKKVKILLDIISIFLLKTTSLKNLQNENNNGIIKNERDSLNALNDKNTSSYKKAESIHSLMNNIHREVGTLVSSVQFQDITRQQIENVCNTFNNLIAKIGIDSEVKSKNKIIYSIHEVAKIQAAQLQNSKNELSKAVADIVSNLEELSNNTQQIIIEISQLLSSTENSSPFLDSLNSKINSILDSLIKNTEVSNELSGSIENITDIINELTEFIEKISEIGIEIELIALNTSIKAAHTGKEGAALGVIANSIQKLSADSKTHISPVVNKLSTISKISEKLQNVISTNSSSEARTLLKTISNDISNTLNSIKSMVKNAVLLLGNIQNSVVKMKHEIAETISAITIHLQMEDQINEVLNQLDTIINRSGEISDNSLLHNTELDGYRKDYTMKIQRDIHDSISAGKEKFLRKTSVIKKIKKEQKSQNEFGDNVELF